MGLPKLWAKDSTGTKGFTFSHVKTIYYNWAQKKLLKTKLDEMDDAIENKTDNILILDTVEEVMANTEPNRVAGALALKQVNSDLGGLKTYTSVWQLGLAAESISNLSQIITAMPNKSVLLCASDSQAPNIQFPSDYGTIEIKRVDLNRVSLKYYVSSSVANGKTYTGSYHSSNGFSGWFD